MRRPGLGVLAALAAALAACSQNPVLGEWEIDREDSRRGAVLAAEAMQLDRLTLARNAISAEGTDIPVSYVVEGDRVRVVRDDGRGEHRIQLLADGRIRVELPAGVSAVYRKAGS